jgi:glycosyltransferase involved in cell wall biosynthesis
MPKYSIVIPTYNHLEDCLKPCIESIIQHTDLQDVEIIIVANGCTDDTLKHFYSKMASF